MQLVPVDFNQIKKQNRGRSKSVKLMVEAFVNSGSDCCRVIDEEKLYHNNNDLCRAIKQSLKNHEVTCVKAFLANGEVYLKRI